MFSARHLDMGTSTVLTAGAFRFFRDHALRHLSVEVRTSPITNGLLAALRVPVRLPMIAQRCRPNLEAVMTIAFAIREERYFKGQQGVVTPALP